MRYALSSGAPALVVYRRGGVLLSELARGACKCLCALPCEKFALICFCLALVAIVVVGGSYDHTVDTLLLSAATNIVSDNVSHVQAVRMYHTN